MTHSSRPAEANALHDYYDKNPHKLRSSGANPLATQTEMGFELGRLLLFTPPLRRPACGHRVGKTNVRKPTDERRSRAVRRRFGYGPLAE